MKKSFRKDPTQLERLSNWIDRLISIGFGLGVLVLLILFVYVLVTQFLAQK